MASTYSTLKIQLMATGENSTTWGTVTNLNLGTAIEEAISGSATVTFASGPVTLSLTDSNASQTARHMRLQLVGTSGGPQNLIVPTFTKLYLISNGCADTITVKTAAGTGVAVPSLSNALVFVDGTNVVSALTYLTSLKLGSALPIDSGGTGAVTAPAALAALGAQAALGFTPYNATNPNGYISSITSGNVTTALGFTPYNASNPSGYISSITSGNVTTALGFTPYNATNPNGYISSITSGNVTTALGFTPANNAGLAGLTSPATARSNLGVGSRALGNSFVQPIGSDPTSAPGDIVFEY
jgi:hypothetical protein